jgi:hypothetical protein
LQLHVLHAATEAETEAAFAGFAQLRAGVIGAALFSSNHSGAKDGALSSANCGSFKGWTSPRKVTLCTKHATHLHHGIAPGSLSATLALILIGAPEIGRS